MKKIMLILVGKRRDAAINVQSLLTEYGCFIKTRLGIHEASNNVCAEEGMIILELVGEDAKHDQLFNALQKIDCVHAKLEMLTVDNC